MRMAVYISECAALIHEISVLVVTMAD